MINRRRITNSINPLNIAPGSMFLWLDAADQSTITLNGATVSAWADKSGRGNHVTQGTALNQPTYTANGQNGLPMLTFTSAASTAMSSAAFTKLTAPITAFVVAQWTDAIVVNVHGGVFDGSSANRVLMRMNNAGYNLYISGTTPSSIVECSVSDLFPHICVATAWPGVKGQLYLDGVYFEATSAVSADAGMDQVRLGSNPLDGSIMEVIAYNAMFSYREIRQVQTCLHRKWAIPLIAP